MTKFPTDNYKAEVDTQFKWATEDIDPFDRTDLANLAQAVERHNHATGRGLSIPASALGTASITSDKLQDGAITNAKLGPDSVTADKMAPNSVGASEIVDLSVGTTELGANVVTQAKMAPNSVGAPEIIDGSVGANELAAGAVTDIKLATPKVNRTAPAYASFALAMAEISAFCYINNPGSIADAPIPSTLDWLLMQIRHPALNYFWQLTCSLINQDELYTRSVIAGSPGPWRKVWHAGNAPFVLLTGSTMSGNLAFSDTLEGVLLAGGSHLRDDVVGNSLQILSNGARCTIYNETGSLTLGDFNNGALSLNGPLNVGLQPVTAPRFVSTVAVGTPPFTVTSDTLVPKLNVERFGGKTYDEMKADVLDDIPAAASPIPVGLVAIWKTATPPGGWTIDTDLAGYMLAGAGGSPAWYGSALLVPGGSPSHSHAMDHQHAQGTTAIQTGSGTGSSSSSPPPSFSTDTHQHNFTTPALGATPRSEVVANIPPYKCIHYIVKGP